MATNLQPAFTAGELSPYLQDRVDLEKYRSGCTTLQNFLLTPYGPVRKRPGTEYINGAVSNTVASRMIKFQFSAKVGYIIEMSTGVLNFYVNRAKVASTVAHPYLDSEFREVQVAQLNDVMWFTHPNHEVMKLSRTDAGVFTLAEVEYLEPPLREENTLDTHTMTADAITGTGITLISTLPIFDEDHIGGYFRIGHYQDTTQITQSLRFTGTSASMPVRGDWEIITTGSWDARLRIERSVSNGPWRTLREWVDTTGTRNFTATGTELNPEASYRIAVLKLGTSGSDSNPPEPTAIFEVVNPVHYGMVKVTAYASSTSVTVTAVQPLSPTNGTTATELWSEGAWSDFRGHPRTVTGHESRLFFGGNRAEAQTLWASDIDAYDTFTALNFEDSDSFSYTIGASEYNEIQWMATSPRNLMVGTTGGEWSFSSGSEELTLTPTNARARRESAWGADHIQAISTSNVILFVEQGGRKVRELAYSFEQDGFISADLLQLSEHLGEGGIKEIALQRHRDTTIWAVTGAGNLLSLTYDRAANIVGWARHVTKGSFESVAVVNTGGEEDEIWVCVKRTINGGTVRFIESFYPDMWRMQEDLEQDDLFYVDAGVRYSGASTSQVTGLSHLLNETLAVLENGANTPLRAVSGTGTVDLVNPSTTVILGIPFTAEVSPMPWETATEEGTSQGREKRIHEAVVNIYKSGVFKVGVEGAQDQVYLRDTSDPMDSPPPLATKQICKVLPRKNDKRAYIRVISDAPLPLTVISIVAKYNVVGK
jgi:hypothetical protein